MRGLLRMMLVCMVVSQLSFICLAQVGIITTHAGLGLPANGAMAITQPIDSPSPAAPDGAGGFYVASSTQNNVYRVSANGRITLIAGSGRYGYSGDGGPATLARLANPSGIARDSANNLYIADTYNRRIRKVSSSGIITTVAGNGMQGYGGDGGPATSAQFQNPYGIAADSAGNVYIADSYDNRIRKVSPSGIITTAAGNGSSGFGGGGYSGDNGPATSAQLNNPHGVAVDSAGNLFIADQANSRIRKVSLSGIITTVAGNGSNGYSGDGGPATLAKISYSQGVAVDSAGNIYFTDGNNGRIRKVSSLGIITSVAGNGSQAGRGYYGDNGDGGPAILALLTSPYGVAVDSAGNLFVTSADRIRKVSLSGIITTVAGNGSSGYSGDNGPATSAQLNTPNGVAVDSAGNLYIADAFNSRIRKLSPSGIITTFAGNGTFGYSGDGGLATSAQLNQPSGVAVDSTGNLYISDLNRIRKVDSSGIITTVAGNGTFGYGGDGGLATSARLNLPGGVAVDSAGNLFIADSNNYRIRKVSSKGIITTVAGNGSQGYGGYGGPATSAQIAHPCGVAVDSAGNLYIADNMTVRILKVSPDGIIIAVADGEWGSGNGTPATSARITSANGVAVDSSGSLFIAGSSLIYKLSSSGIITTMAGNGFGGYSGDNGPATSAQLNFPSGIAADSAGNLFIADTNNHRIRKVSKPNASIDLALSAAGAGQSSTVGGNLAAQPGYATVDVKSGAVPYGTAVFRFQQDGVTVSEAGVPASPPTLSARVFIEYRSNVNAVPARSDAGIVDINTGIAVVNYGTATASVTYTLRNADGVPVAIGHGTIAAGKHFGCFIDQLKDTAAPDFNLPADFQNSIQFGSLDIAGDQPLSVMPLRGTANQRKQFLITTTPVADLIKSPGNSPLYFPQFTDGGGYTTSLILMNTSTALETGTLQIMDNKGSPLFVHQAGGTSGSAFSYSIRPNGIFRFQTDGSPSDAKAGWVQLIPDEGTSTPIGSGVFGFNPVNVLVTESGVPGASATTHARIYVDLSERHDTGLAIANIGEAAANIAINAFQTDGVTAVGTNNGPLSLAAYGHDSRFASQFISGLPPGFTGVLDVRSTTPFTALTVRSLYNENNDFLMTTFPVADVNQTAPSPIVFPQIADGGGYATQFLLLSTSGASSAKIHYYDNNGAPLAVGR